MFEGGVCGLARRAAGDSVRLFGPAVLKVRCHDRVPTAIAESKRHGAARKGPSEMPTIDGSLADWPAGARLDTPQTGTAGYGLYGTTDEGHFYFATTSDIGPVGEHTTLWIDADLDRGTGYQIWGWTGGTEYNVEVGADGVPRLYGGGPGQTYITDLEYAYSADRGILEFRIARADIGAPDRLRVFADVNNTAFIPNDYGSVNLFVGQGQAAVDAGGKTLDGDLSEWSADTRLDAPGTGVAGYAVHGDLQGGVYTVAVATDGLAIGTNTTIWIDADLDRSTGYQIWGWAGGAEYNVNFGADGVARLYSGAAGQTLVGAINYGLSADGSVVELAIDAALIGSPEAIRLFTDVNDAVFLPNDYSTANFVIGEVAPIVIGGTTLDGIVGAEEWPGTELLYDSAPGGDPGYRLLGAIEEDTPAGDVFVLAIESEIATIGANTTVWIDTDLDAATGYQIWGWAGGAEYNVNVGADGVARLYSGGAGETFVSDLDFRIADSGSGFEVALPQGLLAGNPTAVRVLADVNDQVFLPGAYAGSNLVIRPDLPPVDPVDDPQVRIGIIYSETTAANYYNITNYGQLFMSAQNQAMQAGIPFDLLTEADLLDPANLARYDTLVFPGFSHVKSAQVDAIASSLAAAQSLYGVGLIAAGNFLTNDESGAALPGNSYARMSSLLGVTLEGFGQTNGIDLKATGASHPILDTYAGGQLVGEYGNASYLHFIDTTGAGQVLFNQTVTTGNGGTATHDAVIATETAARNVHFATDAIIGNNNILGKAIDWVAGDNAPDVSLLMTRGSSLFYSRNDMDQAQEAYDVIEQDPGIYDAMLPIIEKWYQDWGFVGSYYIDIGANPPDQRTDWSVSKPYYDAIRALESEIGSHSFTHPHDTNTLLPDTPEILALASRVDPRNPNAVDPWTLTQAEQDLLYASYRFQFETSKLIIEKELGVAVTGAAVPGAPENVDATREMIRFYDYLSGGFSGVGAGYPGAFGFLTPGETERVYLAPNVSFDFSLIEFQGMTPAQATAVWLSEYARITGNATAPIIAFPWHDYGPTNWDLGGSNVTYTLEMFEALIGQAAADGAEFVTGADLADRIASFAASSLTTSRSGNVVTATVASSDAGHFALDLGKEGKIASVAGWYAYDDDSVFLPRSGGTFGITLGTTPADVTHINDPGQRNELISLSGDGTDLNFVLAGASDVHIDLKTQGSQRIKITGADDAGFETDGDLVLAFDAGGQHSVVLDMSTGTTVLEGGAGRDILIGGTGADRLNGNGGNDLLIGGAGADRLNGNAGIDVLDGGAGNDTVQGGAGIDRLSGGSGNDSLRGQGGRDTFVFQANGGADTVIDFVANTDALEFNGLGFADAAAALAGFVDTAGGARLSFSDGGSVLLSGVGVALLDVDDIIVDPLQLA